MRFYSGIHLHGKESAICVIDDSGTIHFRGNLPNSIDHFLEVLNSYKPRPAGAAEATLNW